MKTSGMSVRGVHNPLIVISHNSSMTIIILLIFASDRALSSHVAGCINELPRWWDNITYRYQPNAAYDPGSAPASAAPASRFASQRVPPPLSLSLAAAPSSRMLLVSQGLLSQPSVRFRKTINTKGPEGEVMAVNAQWWVPRSGLGG